MVKPRAITYGTVLSSTQLNATANVPGVFTYTPAVGALLNAGTNQVLSVDFMPTNAVDYSPVLGTTVMITVNKTNLTATANNLSKACWRSNPPLAITYTGFVATERLRQYWMYCLRQYYGHSQFVCKQLPQFLVDRIIIILLIMQQVHSQ